MSTEIGPGKDSPQHRPPTPADHDATVLRVEALASWQKDEYLIHDLQGAAQFPNRGAEILPSRDGPAFLVNGVPGCVPSVREPLED